MAINESILNGSNILLFHGTAAKNKGKFEVKKPSNFYPFFCTEDIDYAKNYSEKTGSLLQKRQENSKIYIIQLKDNVKYCDFQNQADMKKCGFPEFIVNEFKQNVDDTQIWTIGNMLYNGIEAIKKLKLTPKKLANITIQSIEQYNKEFEGTKSYSLSKVHIPDSVQDDNALKLFFDAVVWALDECKKENIKPTKAIALDSIGIHALLYKKILDAGFFVLKQNEFGNICYGILDISVLKKIYPDYIPAENIDDVVDALSNYKTYADKLSIISKFLK